MNAKANIATPFADHVAAREPGDDFKVFPCIPNGKTPATRHGHKDATADPDQLRAWADENPACNTAHCPEDSGHLVLDVDPKNDGEESLAALIAEHGPLPETYTVRTPSGGRHYYFVGSAPVSAGKLGKGLDVRGRGGYVLLPGSRTEQGEYVTVSDKPTVPAPAWLMEKINAPAHERKTAPANIELDLPHNVERARGELRRLIAQDGDVIEGCGGDARTVHAARVCADFGLSTETAYDSLEEEWNTHCFPKWEQAELEKKIENGYAYRQNDIGCYALPPISEIFADFQFTPEPIPAPPNGPVSFSTVLTRTVPPVQELIAGLVEKGTVTFLSAPGGSHKSRLAVQWGLCIDAKLPIFGRTVERATFVYVSYEDHPDEVARRSQAIARCLNLPSDSAGQFWDLSGKDAPLAMIREDGTYELLPLWQTLNNHLQSIPGHKFVVFDSTYNAMRFAGQAKINETSVMVGIGLFQRLCNETDATCLCLWHPSQAGQERGDASGWSVAWHNAPRARFSLAAVKDVEDAYELKVEKRNHGAKGKPITLYFTGGALLPRAETDTQEQQARYLDACVRVALMAAQQGAPIQKQRRLNKWMFDIIESAAGYRPPEREIKETLATALHLGRLRYMKGSQYRTAGYYPADENLAAELANGAKRRAGNGGGDA